MKLNTDLEYDIIEFLNSIGYPDVDDEIPNRQVARDLIRELDNKKIRKNK